MSPAVPSSMTISTRAEVEVTGNVALREARWESPLDFVLDLDFGGVLGGAIVSLSHNDALRLAAAIQRGRGV